MEKEPCARNKKMCSLWSEEKIETKNSTFIMDADLIGKSLDEIIKEKKLDKRIGEFVIDVDLMETHLERIIKVFILLKIFPIHCSFYLGFQYLFCCLAVSPYFKEVPEGGKATEYSFEDLEKMVEEIKGETNGRI